MAISIDGVVYKVSADTSEFATAMKRVEALQEKQAKMTEKYDNDKINSLAKVSLAEEKLETLREEYASIQNASSKEEIRRRKEIEKQIKSQERAIESLKDKQKLAAMVHNESLKKTQAEIEKLSEKTNAYSVNLENLANSFTKITVPISLLGGFALKQWGDQEEAIAQMESALRANGYSVEDYSGKFQELAKNIQSLTNTTSNTINENQQYALSLGISADKMEWANKGAVALSQAFNISLNSSTKMLSEALNGNFNALSRNISELENAGTETEKMAILNEFLSKNFEAAQKRAETFNGVLRGAQIAMADAGAAAGKEIAPAIKVLANSVKGLAEWFGGLSDTSKRAAVIIMGLSASLPLLAKAVLLAKTAWTTYTLAMAGATAATHAFKAALVKTGIGAAIVAIGYAISFAMEKWDEWTNKTKEASEETNKTGNAQTSLSSKIEKTTQAIKEEAKALEEARIKSKEYYDSLNELEKLQRDRRFQQKNENEQLEELNELYKQAKSRIELLQNDLENWGLSIEERTFKQKELLKWTKELYSIEDKISGIRDKQSAAEKKRQEKAESERKKEQDKYNAEQEALFEENKRIANLQNEYRENLRLEILKKQGNERLVKKIEFEERVAELMENQRFSQEEAYKFAKMELKLKEKQSGKKVKYADEDVKRAKRIVEKGLGGKKTQEQAKAILAGEEYKGDEMASFQGARSRARREKGGNFVPTANELFSDAKSTKDGTPQMVNSGKQQTESGGIAGKLDEILQAVNKVPDTLNNLFSES